MQPDPLPRAVVHLGARVMWKPFKRSGEPKPPKERRSPFFGGQKNKPAAPPAGKHGPVREADPYAFAVAHKRQAWLLRLSVGTNVALAAAVIAQAGAISELVPAQHLALGLVRIEPSTDRTVKVDPASLIRVEPITAKADGYDLLMESFVRRYTRLLLEIDKVSQDDRMKQAGIFSDAAYWKRFGEERFREIEKAMNDGINRSIVVESADLVSRREGVSRYAVDIVQTDERRGEVIETKKLRAYIAVAARPQTVRPSERFENPAGFRVLDLALKERGNS